MAGAFGALSAQADDNGGALVADLDTEQATVESQPAASRSAPDIDLKDVEIGRAHV